MGTTVGAQTTLSSSKNVRIESPKFRTFTPSTLALPPFMRQGLCIHLEVRYMKEADGDKRECDDTGFTLLCLSLVRSDRSYPYRQSFFHTRYLFHLTLTIMLRITKSPSFSLLKRSLATHTAATPPTRHDWTKEEVKRIYDAPLLDLVFRSAGVHRQHHDPSKIQLCTLMNIKSK